MPEADFKLEMVIQTADPRLDGLLCGVEAYPATHNGPRLQIERNFQDTKSILVEAS